MSRAESSLDEKLIAGDALRCIIPGIAAATGASNEIAQKLLEILRGVENPRRQESGVADASVGCLFRVWYKRLLSLDPNKTENLHQLLYVILAIAVLREHVKCQQAPSPSCLDTIWTLLCSAFLLTSDSSLGFHVARSTQGYLTVPLCNLLNNGDLKELWSVHVWLPDGTKGDLNSAVDAQRSYGKDWVLAGPALLCTEGVEHAAAQGKRLRASLVLFNANIDSQPGANVLSPEDGNGAAKSRPLLKPTADVLARIVDATREWERTNTMSPGENEAPAVLAYYDLFCGLALLERGRVDDAALHLSPKDRCSPALTFAREPYGQHRLYLRKLAEVSHAFDTVDEAGYTALDYAFQANDVELQQLIVTSLQHTFDDRKIQRRLYEASVRKSYREVFEARLKPILQAGRKEALECMRLTYAGILEGSEQKTKVFDRLKFVWYSDFCASGRLPRSTDGTMKIFPSHPRSAYPRHIIYLAYRWITRDPVTGKTANDDSRHTQYRRMLQALRDYLHVRENVDPSTLGIWLDSSCIDRKNPLPGIAALPINLAQCDTLITIEDERFWERAWCSVEALIIQVLYRRYRRHRWFRYAASPEKSEPNEAWALRESAMNMQIDMSSKAMTWEEDRDKITFLERQAELL